MRDVGAVKVDFSLIISQLISLEEREQFMTVKVWLPQIWTDERLKWDPEEFGNITKIQLPGEALWRPELVLYNNADGNYEGENFFPILEQTNCVVNFLRSLTLVLTKY